MAKKMNTLDWVAFVLVVVGGINWGLVALNYNLVQAILGVGTLAKIVYGLVGLAALYSIVKVVKK